MNDEHRTVHAQQAFEFGDVFGYKFNPLSFGASVKRRLTLSEPDGLSTAGGRQSRQSLVLIPEDDESAGNVVIGFIDTVHKNAEVRSFNAVSQQFSARYGRKFDLEREAFDLLLAELGGFLKIQKIDYQVIEAAHIPKKPAPPPEPVAPSNANLGALLGMLALGILIGFGFGWLVFS
ncbi:MAG: hypothetical protein RIT81_25270 [Deltaproteobacteria bacterium]